MNNDKIKLSEAKKGDYIKFSRNGMIWKVVEKTNGNVLNSVIVLTAVQTGTFRVYSSVDKKWSSEVFLFNQ